MSVVNPSLGPQSDFPRALTLINLETENMDERYHRADLHEIWYLIC